MYFNFFHRLSKKPKSNKDLIDEKITSVQAKNNVLQDENTNVEVNIFTFYIILNMSIILKKN